MFVPLGVPEPFGPPVPGVSSYGVFLLLGVFKQLFTVFAVVSYIWLYFSCKCFL